MRSCSRSRRSSISYNRGVLIVFATPHIHFSALNKRYSCKSSSWGPSIEALPTPPHIRRAPCQHHT